ncbi:MAG: phosphatase PAP2 family protein, partial [Calditrichota bacterium]
MKLQNGTDQMDGSETTTYRLSDIFFLSYNAVAVIFLILSGAAVEYRWWLLLSNLALILANVAVIQYHEIRPNNRLISFARLWYPFVYFSYLHWESGMLRHLFHLHSFDPLVRSWDLAIFGDYLHNILYQFQPLWFAEFVHFTYFFYYLLLLLPAFLYFRSDLRRFKNYIFDITLLYLIQYTVFYVFPVIGPIALHSTRFPNGVLFIPLMKFLYRMGDSPGGAMPSSHVSVAVLAWTWLWRYDKRYALALSLFTVSLFFSTVYLSYHYAV